MSAEENKALIRRFVETVWNGKNIDAFDEFQAAEFTMNGSPSTLEEFKAFLRGFLADSPDLKNTIEDIVANDDKVAYRWVMRRTDQATGKQVATRGMTFNRIADGKIVEDWFSSEVIEE